MKYNQLVFLFLLLLILFYFCYSTFNKENYTNGLDDTISLDKSIIASIPISSSPQKKRIIRKIYKSDEDDKKNEKIKLIYQYQRKQINVILDLDHTILHSISMNEVHKLPEEFQRKFTFVDFNNQLRIFARPHLQQFLDFLFENFNVSVFTAGTDSYAKFIVNNFIIHKDKPERSIDVIFSRDDVDIAHMKYGKMKNLQYFYDHFYTGKQLEYNRCNTVIIDDTIDVITSNPNNSIEINPFRIITTNYKSCNQLALLDNGFHSIIMTLLNMKEYYNISGCIYDINSPLPSSC